MIHVEPPPDHAAISHGPSSDELGPPRAITYLRVAVTDRCNLRCRYCMPDDQVFLPHPELLSFEEITAVARVLVEEGVRKIRITGGEPLVRRELPTLVSMLHRISDQLEVVLTSNGMLLAPFARQLKNAGLDRINISLDTLRPERFLRLSRRPGLDRVLAGIEAVRKAGFEQTRLNMVVMGGINDDEVGDMLRFAGERGLEQRFIEFMPMTSNGYGAGGVRVPADEIRLRIEAAGDLEARPRGTGPADTYRLVSTGQKLGIIVAISAPFCERCNRVRLTADGMLRSCLFEGGSVPVRDIVRGSDLETGIRGALDYLRRVKPPVHAGFGHVQMNRVGG